VAGHALATEALTQARVEVAQAEARGMQIVLSQINPALPPHHPRGARRYADRAHRAGAWSRSTMRSENVVAAVPKTAR